MDVTRLISDLSRPDAYPGPVEDVTVHQTHASVVFLAGDRAYKVKKPVDLGFLDFTTPERRLRACEDEVRLNRRLAPHVYLRVVPILDTGRGLRIGGSGGPVVEHAVEMVRLPAAATLDARLAAGEPLEEPLQRLGARIAAFHAAAARGPEIAALGRWDVVAANARDNLTQSRAQVGLTVSPAVYRRLDRVLEDRLRELRPLVESRASAGVPCDTHGDLHLDHVYVLPDAPPPEDLVVVDCIEFDTRFRYADPVSDVAFLSMDLAFRGRRDLGELFENAYFAATDDPEGPRLLPFYRAYRAAVRAKVRGLMAAEPEVGEADRRKAARKARGHWLMSLSELEPPDVRPALVLVGGLPGTGKSTVARGLADALGFDVVVADRVRKSLAGLDPEADAAAAFESGIYAPEWTHRTYDALLDAAREGLFEGRRVAVDATFRSEHERRDFIELAVSMGVRAVLLLCVADPQVARSRLDRRAEGISDADQAVYAAMAERWETPGPDVRRWTVEVDSGGTPEASVRNAVLALADRGLSGG